jgi:hypothetical protein
VQLQPARQGNTSPAALVPVVQQEHSRLLRMQPRALSARLAVLVWAVDLSSIPAPLQFMPEQECA